MRRTLLVAATLIVGSLLAACGGDDGPEVVLSPAGERGREVARAQGCGSCHTTDGSRGPGPTWKGLAGSEVELSDGRTVVADEDYLRRAILDPRSEVKRGWANIMPVYEGQIADDELDDLIAYLQDLAPEPDPDPDETGSGGGSGGP